VFDGARFADAALFEGATFADIASFRHVVFSGATKFGYARFAGGSAWFDSARFCGPPYVYGAGTEDFAGADFEKAEFSWPVYFRAANFLEGADFRGVVFRSRAWFGKAEMKGPTSFEAAEFTSEPPEFSDAALHEGTVWRRVKWPLPLPVSGRRKNKAKPTPTTAGTFVATHMPV